MLRAFARVHARHPDFVLEIYGGGEDTAAEQAARYAADHGFDWYCTTLSISPMKDPVRLNELGTELGRQYGVPFLPSEFRKKDGYKRSLQLSAEYGLYRQDYCGCVFSKREREATAK